MTTSRGPFSRVSNEIRTLGQAILICALGAALAACGSGGGGGSSGGGGSGSSGGPSTTTLPANTPTSSTITSNQFTYYSITTTISQLYLFAAYNFSDDINVNKSGGLFAPITCDIHDLTGRASAVDPEECLFTATAAQTVIPVYGAVAGPTSYIALAMPLPPATNSAEGTSGIPIGLTLDTPHAGHVTASGTSYYGIGGLSTGATYYLYVAGVDPATETVTVDAYTDTGFTTHVVCLVDANGNVGGNASFATTALAACKFTGTTQLYISVAGDTFGQAGFAIGID